MSTLSHYRRILVVRALQLGDLLCAVPALSSLRKWQPEAEITLCGLPWARDFVNRYSMYIDRFVEFPGYKGIPEQPFRYEALQQFISACHCKPYDLVIQLHGSGQDINEFVRSLQARDTAGFHPRGQANLALNHSIEWPEFGHEIERLKSLVLNLGAPDTGNALELPLTEDERLQANELLRGHGLAPDCRYICLHAGGRSLTRRWPVEKYARVASQLADEGWAIILTGSEFELDLAEQLCGLLRNRCINLVGQTSFGCIAALIANARLLLSNDTGVSHIAAALGTPSVVLVLGSEPSRWFPLNRALHREVSIDVPCRPCSHKTCPIGFRCAHELHSEVVYSAVQAALTSQSA